MSNVHTLLHCIECVSVAVLEYVFENVFIFVLIRKFWISRGAPSPLLDETHLIPIFFSPQALTVLIIVSMFLC